MLPDLPCPTCLDYGVASTPLTVENIKEEKSRRDTSSPMQRQSIENHLKFLNKEIEAIEAQIRRLTRESKNLKEQAEAITTVEGVGEVTAWTILAYLVELADVKRNQAVALAGLAPYNRDSGKTFKPRCIQGGRAKIRRCLYMAAMSAVKHNEHLKTYYERLVKAGKVKKVALVAVMRKLLIHIRALLINHKNVVAV